jgi:prenyl protein peptidase
MISSRGIVEPCGHRQCATSTAIAYCSLLAFAYVGSLYVFVPPMIRKLSRDHPTHIKYRSQACLIVCAGAILSYPSVFCADENASSLAISIDDDINRPLFSVGRTMLLPPLGDQSFRDIFGVLLHTCILYTGPSVASLLYNYEFRKRSATRRNPPTLSELAKGYLKGFIPNNEQRFWIALRNYFIAPWTEEIIFRGCMIQALLSTGMSGKKVALIAPLFFGIAHVHHAIKRLANGEKPKIVVLATVFQFLYTSFFGSYASHAFVRVGSVLSVTLSHSYCNWMGLPDLGCFGNSQHFLYPHRRVLLVFYLVGIGAFWYLFRLDVLLPLPPELPGLIQSK